MQLESKSVLSSPSLVHRKTAEEREGSSSDYRTLRYWRAVHRQAGSAFGETARDALTFSAHLFRDPTAGLLLRWMVRRAIVRVISTHPADALWFLRTCDYGWSRLVAQKAVDRAFLRSECAAQWRSYRESIARAESAKTPR